MTYRDANYIHRHADVTPTSSDFYSNVFTAAELNWPAASWPSYTTRYWSRASASRSWLAAGLQCESCSSVQFSSCAVNTRTGIGYTWYLSRTRREAETSDADYFLFLLVVSANTYSLAAHRRFCLAAVWRLACARFVYDYALYKFTFIIIILSVCLSVSSKKR